MGESSHIVDEAIFEFTLDHKKARNEDEDFLLDLTRDHLLAQAEEVFDDFCADGAQYRFDRVEIDLGNLPADTVATEVGTLFRDALRSALAQKVAGIAAKPTESEWRIGPDEAELESLLTFLEQGRPPTRRARQRPRALLKTLAIALVREADQVRSYLAASPRQQILLERIVTNFGIEIAHILYRQWTADAHSFHEERGQKPTSRNEWVKALQSSLSTPQDTAPHLTAALRQAMLERALDSGRWEELAPIWDALRLGQPDLLRAAVRDRLDAPESRRILVAGWPRQRLTELAAAVDPLAAAWFATTEERLARLPRLAQHPLWLPAFWDASLAALALGLRQRFDPRRYLLALRTTLAPATLATAESRRPEDGDTHPSDSAEAALWAELAALDGAPATPGAPATAQAQASPPAALGEPTHAWVEPTDARAPAPVTVPPDRPILLHTLADHLALPPGEARRFPALLARLATLDSAALGALRRALQADLASLELSSLDAPSARDVLLALLGHAPGMTALHEEIARHADALAQPAVYFQTLLTTLLRDEVIDLEAALAASQPAPSPAALPLTDAAAPQRPPQTPVPAQAAAPATPTTTQAAPTDAPPPTPASVPLAPPATTTTADTAPLLTAALREAMLERALDSGRWEELAPIWDALRLGQPDLLRAAVRDRLDAPESRRILVAGWPRQRLTELAAAVDPLAAAWFATTEERLARLPRLAQHPLWLPAFWDASLAALALGLRQRFDPRRYLLALRTTLAPATLATAESRRPEDGDTHPSDSAEAALWAELAALDGAPATPGAPATAQAQASPPAALGEPTHAWVEPTDARAPAPVTVPPDRPILLHTLADHLALPPGEARRFPALLARLATLDSAALGALRRALQADLASLELSSLDAPSARDVLLALLGHAPGMTALHEEIARHADALAQPAVYFQTLLTTLLRDEVIDLEAALAASQPAPSPAALPLTDAAAPQRPPQTPVPAQAAAPATPTTTQAAPTDAPPPTPASVPLAPPATTTTADTAPLLTAALREAMLERALDSGRWEELAPIWDALRLGQPDLLRAAVRDRLDAPESRRILVAGWPRQRLTELAAAVDPLAAAWFATTEERLARLPRLAQHPLWLPAFWDASLAALALGLRQRFDPRRYLLALRTTLAPATLATAESRRPEDGDTHPSDSAEAALWAELAALDGAPATPGAPATAQAQASPPAALGEPTHAWVEPTDARAPAPVTVPPDRPILLHTLADHLALPPGEARRFPALLARLATLDSAALGALRRALQADLASLELSSLDAPSARDVLLALLGHAPGMTALHEEIARHADALAQPAVYFQTLLTTLLRDEVIDLEAALAASQPAPSPAALPLTDAAAPQRPPQTPVPAQAAAPATPTTTQAAPTDAPPPTPASVPLAPPATTTTADTAPLLTAALREAMLERALDSGRWEELAPIWDALRLGQPDLLRAAVRDRLDAPESRRILVAGWPRQRLTELAAAVDPLAAAWFATTEERLARLPRLAQHPLWLPAFWDASLAALALGLRQRFDPRRYLLALRTTLAPATLATAESRRPEDGDTHPSDSAEAALWAELAALDGAPATPGAPATAQAQASPPAALGEPTHAWVEPTDARAPAPVTVPPDRPILLHTLADHLALPPGEARRFPALLARLATLDSAALGALRRALQADLASLELSSLDAPSARDVLLALLGHAPGMTALHEEIARHADALAQPAVYFQTLLTTLLRDEVIDLEAALAASQPAPSPAALPLTDAAAPQRPPQTPVPAQAAAPATPTTTQAAPTDAPPPTPASVPLAPPATTTTADTAPLLTAALREAMLERALDSGRWEELAPIWDALRLGQPDLLRAAVRDRLDAPESRRILVAGWPRQRLTELAAAVDPLAAAWFATTEERLARLPRLAQHPLWLPAFWDASLAALALGLRQRFDPRRYLLALRTTLAPATLATAESRRPEDGDTHPSDSAEAALWAELAALDGAPATPGAPATAQAQASPPAALGEPTHAWVEPTDARAPAPVTVPPDRPILLHTLADHLALPPGEARRFPALLARLATLDSAALGALRRALQADLASLELSSLDAPSARDVLLALLGHAPGMTALHEEIARHADALAQPAVYFQTLLTTLLRDEVIDLEAALAASQPAPSPAALPLTDAAAPQRPPQTPVPAQAAAPATPTTTQAAPTDAPPPTPASVPLAPPATTTTADTAPLLTAALREAMLERALDSGRWEELAPIWDALRLGQPDLLRAAVRDRLDAPESRRILVAGWPRQRLTELAAAVDPLAAAWFATTEERLARLPRLAQHPLWLPAFWDASLAALALGLRQRFDPRRYLLALRTTLAPATLATREISARSEIRAPGVDAPSDPGAEARLWGGLNALTKTPTPERANEPSRWPWRKQLDEPTLYVANAGLALVAPYLPRLFGLVGLTDGRQFIDESAAWRGVALLHAVATNEVSAADYLLGFGKLLCGLDMETPIPDFVQVSPQELATIEEMLKSVIQSWSIIGNTSVSGLRESFLQRGGQLAQLEDAWSLEVDSKSFDMLLDKLPWSIAVIKYHWMAKPVHVSWR